MKWGQLKELSAEELTQRLEGLEKALLDLRMEKAGGKLAKPHEFRRTRVERARILTLLQRPAGAGPGASGKEGPRGA